MSRSKKDMIKSRKRKIVLWDEMISDYNKKIDRLRGYIIEAHEDIDRIEKNLSPKLRKWS